MLRTVKAKNARSKRFLKNREAKVHENPKSTLFVKGSTTSQVVTDALKDLFSLKRANAAYFSKKNEIKPFEDETKIEFLSRKNDAAFLVVGTHSKKRPHNLTFVRMFDYQILDMFELGIEKGTFLSEIKGPKCSTGIKPLMIFNGERFDQDETYKSIKNYLLDLFNGEVTDFVNLAGLEYVMSWTAAPDNKILLRTYMVQLKKSGVKTPRVELEEMGPMLDMVVRRAEPSKPDLMKRALQMPKELKPKKEKNKELDEMGDQYGRVHLGKQDFNKIQTRKMKGLKRRRNEDADAEDSGDDEPMAEDT